LPCPTKVPAFFPGYLKQQFLKWQSGRAIYIPPDHLRKGSESGNQGTETLQVQTSNLQFLFHSPFTTLCPSPCLFPRVTNLFSWKCLDFVRMCLFITVFLFWYRHYLALSSI
jgi:hypothetical protein